MSSPQLIDIGLYRPGMGACYLIADSNELAIIDCGTRHSVPAILHAIADHGHQPGDVRWIIPTHVHLDHAGGAGHLLAHCPQATLIAHPNGLPHLIDPSLLQASASQVYGAEHYARHYGELQPAPESRCRAAADGATLELGQRQLLLLQTPGHANHHICILDQATGDLYTGDTFGLSYRELAQPHPWLMATTTPVAFDPDAWQASLDRLLALDPTHVCLTHYGRYPQPAQLAPQLRASIEQHRNIALDEEPNPPNGRLERLRQTLATQLMPAASRHSGLSEAQVQTILADDMTLNAQGLEIWLTRRAKHRTGTPHPS
jgi:glyoxylase-like metal-dependent hydrolase (beta-lactamase superfamily II)